MLLYRFSGILLTTLNPDHWINLSHFTIAIRWQKTKAAARNASANAKPQSQTQYYQFIIEGS